MKTTGVEVSVEFPADSPPDFAALLESGWVHPAGLREGEVLANSICKEIEGCQIQLVRHSWSSGNYYTAIFSASRGEIRRRGDGEEFEVEELLEIIRAFSIEIDAVQEEMEF